METKSFQRKHIVPKLNLNKLPTQNHALSSRETTALLNSVREVEYDKALTFESNRYNSKRPELWSSSAFASRKNKTFEEYGDEMYHKIWKNCEQELRTQVSELTLKLDKIRQELSSGKLTFKQAGKLLSKIRREYKDVDNDNDNDDDDLICCLHLVEKLWECVDGDGLSCSEFSSLLSNMFGKPKQEFDVLFQKMDADGDETLSWGEYVSFLSQQQAHLWDQQENKNVSYYKEHFSTVYNNCTGNHMFDKIRIINGEQSSKCTLNSSKYAVLTSDNCIQIRNAMSLQLESSINLDNNCTNLCCLNGNESDGLTRLAVSFMDRSIHIYSPTLNNNNKQSVINVIDNKKYKNNNKIYYDLQHSFFALDIPMCMEIFNEKDSTLLIGETYGTIGLYNYLDHNCLVRVSCHGEENSNGPCVVKQVKNVPRIGIVSAGMDTNIHVTDCVKWCKIRTLSGHTRGVYSIAYSSTSHRMLISAGYDRKICVWDPYITKPLGLLKGHIASVVAVLINEQSNQIITASRDKKIKIWDMRTWKCLQTMRDTSIHSPINEISAIRYDPYQSCLITAGSKFRKWYVQNKKCNDNTDKTLAPIIDIVYSNIFQQIISVHVDDTCILWDIKTGQNSFNFKMNNNCDSNSSDSIATIAIDEIGKRLLTASQNGIIKMWNFNNGAVMHQFPRVNFEITNLIYLPRTLHCVVCCGYSCIVNRCPSHLAPSEANFILQNKLHKTDVRAMCITKQYLLTGSSDGVIIEWHIDSNVKSQIFECKQPYVSITAMYAHKLNGNTSNWYLFVGTEEGIIHIFEKEQCFKYVTSISDKYIFNEPILYIAVNELGTRLMIADCDVTMKLFDIQNLHKTMDFILVKEWKPHQKGCITSLLYIPGFDVFCSSSDSGQLILWNLDGILLGQFGQNIEWKLFGNNITNKNVSNDNNNGRNMDAVNSNDVQHTNSPQIKRKSYFDDHSIYRPKLINTVVSESIARTLLDDRSDKETEEKKDKGQFEQTLEKLMVELMKPKKRKKSCRKSSTFATNKPRTSRKNSRMKM